MSANTTANYLGLQLSSPIIVGACSLTRSPEMVRELAIAGAGAVVLPSLFEEQVVHRLEQRGEVTTPGESQIESFGYDSSGDAYNGGPEDYLSLVSELKKVIGVPVIASLNGCTGGQWLEIAREIEQVGADAIEATLESELNEPNVSADEVEERMLACISELCDMVNIPVSIKLKPHHTNLANLAWRIAEVGAAGVVCFAHDTTWHVEADTVRVVPNWGLTPAGRVNPTISGLIRIRTQGPTFSVAASGGVSSVEDVINTVIAGADTVMIASEIYRSGPDIVSHLLDGLQSYLFRHGFGAFSELVASRPKPKSFMRSMQIDCLTRSNKFVDPTPKVSAETGDRWGHRD